MRDVWTDPGRAAKYATTRFPAARARRERRAFERLLRHLSRGPQVDLPCGAGRLGASLARLGPVVGADASDAMLDAARATGAYASLVRADALTLPFPDGTFAGGACVRLLHHLAAADRRRVLGELARVIRGPFVVSYFDAATLQALRSARKRAARGSRRPIRRAEFAGDLAACGLVALATSRPLPLVAEQTLVAVGRW